MREVQLALSKTVKNTAMAVITDAGGETYIHPKRKEPVGARLALAAQAVAYGKKAAYRGPTYKSMKATSRGIILDFDYVEGGLVAKGGKLTGFTVAGADHKFVNAQAAINGNQVMVWNPEVKYPVAVRYGWADYPVVNLFNKAGLPASPFRTDDFPRYKSPDPQ
jgi:sialate O-acetylesterase